MWKSYAKRKVTQRKFTNSVRLLRHRKDKFGLLRAVEASLLDHAPDYASTIDFLARGL